MALSNYAELVDSISAWLDGSDLGGREADLIALCEAEINSRLAAGIEAGRRIRPMIARSTVLLGAEYVDLPDADSDMIVPLILEIGGLDRPWQVDFIAEDALAGMAFGAEELRGRIGGVIAGGPPRFYSVVGGQFRLLPAPQTVLSSEFTRFVKAPALGADNPTNWVLTNHSNVYLYGALAQGEMFGWNDQGMANWAALFEQAMEQLLNRYPVPANQAPLSSGLAGFGGGGGLSFGSFMAGG